MKLRATLVVLLMVFPLSQIIVMYFILHRLLLPQISGSDLNSLMPLCIAWMMIVLALSFVASIVAGKLIFDPITQLTREIQRVKKGDKKGRLFYVRKNEIGDLAIAFNSLMDAYEEDKDNLAKISEELDKKEAQYNLALSTSNDLTFSFNSATDEIATSPIKWREFFGKEPPKTYQDAFLLAKELIHPEDFGEFEKAFSPAIVRKGSQKGQFGATCEARARANNGTYFWIQNTVSLIGDKADRRIVVKITDIDRIKRKEMDILSESQKDGLTGLLRKNVTEKLISDYLDGDGKKGEHGMLILDIDDFKSINDTAGHLYGDATLTELSKRIQSLFRNTDIVGRIGGDEFLILLKNIKYNNLILEKANSLIEIFNAMSATMQADTGFSCSIGIVKYPSDGTTYRELFAKADKALYKIKDSGKNAYGFYDENHERERFAYSIKKGEHALTRKQDDPLLIKTVKHSKESITQDIFQILYESKDMKKSINLIMEIIGRFYDVSRVYIFELLPGSPQYNYTYEWCNDGIKPDIESFKMTNVEGLSNYKDNFNQDGIFYSEDTSALPDTVYKGQGSNIVHSLLECAILDKGQFAGFIGFEECSDRRFWVKDEIDTLVLVARILGIVLVKERR